MLVDDWVVTVLLSCLLIEAQEFLVVRIIPDSKLELSLIIVDIVDIEVAELHEVSEDLLDHCESHRIPLEAQTRGKVEVSEVESGSQEQLFVQHRGPGDRFFLECKVSRRRDSEGLLLHRIALRVMQGQTFTLDDHSGRIDRLVRLLPVAASLLTCLI